MSQSVSFKITDGYKKTNTRHIDLILVGKTGHGKSSTGDSIIGREKFQSAPSTPSVTSSVQYEVAIYKNCTIKVMDTPGMVDTSDISDPIAASRAIMKQMQNAVILNSVGYHAFLLVFKYGTRFTKEESEYVKRLKHIFGPNFIKRFCILVISHGDIFARNAVGDKHVCFKRWLAEQEYDFQELIQECQNRVVLFDNRSVDQNVRRNQVNELLQYVDNLNTKENRYSDVHFKLAERSQKILFGLNLISDELIEVEFILQRIDVFVNNRLENNTSLENILADCERLYKKSIEKYRCHQFLGDFRQLVFVIENSIRKCYNRMGGLEKRYRKVNKKLKEECKRLAADLLYKYARVQGSESATPFSTTSLNTDISNTQLIQNTENEQKNNVVVDSSNKMTIKEIVDEYDSLEEQMGKLKAELDRDRASYEKIYYTLKNKYCTLLTKNSACLIS